MRIIAHRGASAEAPENTLAAFRRALGLRVGMIELDVHLTADNVPIVIHDPVLSRTTDGQGSVWERRLADLSGLSAGAWYDARFREERVPTLEEVYRLVAGRAEINVEIKGSLAGAEETGRVAMHVARESGAFDQTLFSSFDPNALARCRRESDAARLALLAGPGLPVFSSEGAPADLRDRVGSHVSRWAHLRLEAANLHRTLASEELVRSLHDDGLAVYVYTVDDEAEVEALARIGVDGVFANDIAPLLVRWPARR